MDSEERAVAGPSATLLLVIGEPFSEDHKTQILAEITKGFQCWDGDDTGININDELAQIANRASLGEEGLDGDRVIQNASDHLTVEILINPLTQTVKNSIKKLLLSPAPVKYLIHAGHALLDTGAWVLQDDTFEFRHLAQVFKNADVENGLKQNIEASLTIHTVTDNNWGKSISKADFTNCVRIQLNPSKKQDNIHGILQFTAYVGSFIKVVPLTSLLQASEQFGNISFTRPTLYIFPGCEGDSALFGVNGFNLLVNGGYNRRACFWDFARHLDRVDAMLLTHLASDNIFSIKTVLERKSLDNIHPQIGYLYCNIPEKLLQTAVVNEDEKEGEKDPSLLIDIAAEGAKVAAMAKNAGIPPHPCIRDDKAKSVDPINLYHKLGHGSLDMYALNPSSDSKELKEFYQQWAKKSANLGMSGSFPNQNALSVCTLLVWKPYNLNDKIVRVLFPGNAPQHKIAEGLEKIKTFDFLKHASCTGKDLLKPVAVKKARPSTGTASRTSRMTSSRSDPKQKTDLRTKPSTTSPTKTTRTSKERDDFMKRMSKPKEAVKEKESRPRPSSAASTASSRSSSARKPTSPRKSLSPSKSPSPPKTSPAKTLSTPVKSTPEKSSTDSSSKPKVEESSSKEQTPDIVKTSDGLNDVVDEIPAAVPEPSMSQKEMEANNGETILNEKLQNGFTQPKEAWVNDKSLTEPNANGYMLDHEAEEVKPQALPDPPLTDELSANTFQQEKDNLKIDPGSNFVFANDEEDFGKDRVPIEQNIQYGINNGNARAMGGIQEVDEEEHDDGSCNTSNLSEDGIKTGKINTSVSEHNENGTTMQKDESGETSFNSFDPAAEWGKPMGLPSPKPLRKTTSFVKPSPTRGTSSRSTTSTSTSRTGTARTGSGAMTGRRTASSRSSPPSSKTPPMPSMTPFYVDLTYIPTHGDSMYCDIEFFKRVRARYYVLSSLSPNPKVLDCLVEGKATWENNDLETTIIPTYDNETLRHWIGLNKDKLQELHIDLTPAVSRCTIQLQDLETSLPAYRLEV